MSFFFYLSCWVEVFIDLCHKSDVVFFDFNFENVKCDLVVLNCYICNAIIDL